jgi:hypothetical protein
MSKLTRPDRGAWSFAGMQMIPPAIFILSSVVRVISLPRGFLSNLFGDGIEIFYSVFLRLRS